MHKNRYQSFSGTTPAPPNFPIPPQYPAKGHRDSEVRHRNRPYLQRYYRKAGPQNIQAESKKVEAKLTVPSLQEIFVTCLLHQFSIITFLYDHINVI